MSYLSKKRSKISKKLTRIEELKEKNQAELTRDQQDLISRREELQAETKKFKDIEKQYVAHYNDAGCPSVTSTETKAPKQPK